MAPPTVPAPTGNPWPNLKKYTELDKDPLTFEQGTAHRLANLAAEVIGQLKALQKSAEQLEVISNLSGLETGHGLAEKYSTMGETAKKILGQHVDVLQDMLDVFKAAGKTYDAGEYDNEEMFDRIRVDGNVKLDGPPEW